MTKDDLQKVRDFVAEQNLLDNAVYGMNEEQSKVLAILDAALAAPEPQPVGEVIAHLRGDNIGRLMVSPTQYLLLGTKLYAAPVPAPQREWVGLTDEQENQFVKQLIDCGVGLVVPLYKIIEKIDTALKEKNHG